MLNNLTGWHFLIILVVVLLLFGAPKLPGLARSLGQSLKIFKSEIKPDEPAAASSAAPPATPESASGTGSTAAGAADPDSKP
ncbi:MAG: twin-arginine translocase TatA/TatE family subunit [Cryobacterium sp.]